MWTFVQSDGFILHDSVNASQGFSGNGVGRNNPAMQNVANVGPLPCGLYMMSELIESDPQCGPYVIVLVPNAGNEMFGRSGFRIHGAEISNPDAGSDGCICAPRPVRMDMWEGTDHWLEVVAEN